MQEKRKKKLIIERGKEISAKFRRWHLAIIERENEEKDMDQRPLETFNFT